MAEALKRQAPWWISLALAGMAAFTEYQRSHASRGQSNASQILEIMVEQLAECKQEALSESAAVLDE